MSRHWRIEHGDPLTVFGELPACWAQSIITAPPAGDPGYVIATLGQARRVLRDDGTLWVSLPSGGDGLRISSGLRDRGWLTAPVPPPGRLALFTKQPTFLLASSQAPVVCRRGRQPGRPQTRSGGIWQARLPRRAGCVPARRASAISEQVAATCIAASTVPLVCGACGAPYQRAGRSGGRGRWRSGCIHHLNERGRCLVLDPFCSQASTGIATVRRGRAFLGIAGGERQAHAIRASIERELRSKP